MPQFCSIFLDVAIADKNAAKSGSKIASYKAKHSEAAWLNNSYGIFFELGYLKGIIKKKNSMGKVFKCSYLALMIVLQAMCLIIHVNEC